MKKRIFVFCIVVIVLLSFQNVYGDDWICSDRDECLYSYNKKIIRVSKNIVRVWGKVINDTYDDEYKSYSIVLNEIDCKKKTMKLIKGTKYKMDGSVIQRIGFPDTKPESIIPDSIGESLYNQVCKPKTK